ncbi:LOW QUALITY PROTEIN: hypothetical protein HID58_010144 [Brassica napus]|uniref:Uncharacterized protein n=1 Tax=Brassica napus TaxID=3708 RepID=A0ABQ8DUF7_BRANA|nr:LOW QUALITY PROTEIN: hypothetical protein HID58_010144 [Brassica napus]
MDELEGVKYFYFEDGLNPSDENSALVHRDDFAMNIKLQLFGLVAKQAIFHQLRTVEQLGYITALTQKGPEHIDWRVESLWNSFESKLREISEKEFKLLFLNVTALIDMKLEKPKELEGAISVLLARVSKWNTQVQPKRGRGCGTKVASEAGVNRFLRGIHQDWSSTKSLSIRVCIWDGSQHLKEKASDKNVVPSPSVEIEDIVGFRNSQPLHRSFRGCGQLKLLRT